MPEALNLPAAMVQAAAEELFGWLKDDEWPEDSTREQALDCARDVLTAVLAVCEVDQQDGMRTPEEDFWDEAGWADNYRTAAWLAGHPSQHPLGRRLVITTPAEEVPDAG